MGLREYARKRDFSRTREPKGAKAAQPGWLFVVQKHAASHLHYDFRLQLDGVLKSWAVPKGPSLDPRQRRLAVHVEDHPVEYGDFEGIIPQGEYGGGTVMLWDRGSWEPVGDPRNGYREGKLKFTLHGEKLRGGWVLVRKGGATADDERNWFLIKERDAEAHSAEETNLVDEAPLSVATNRSMDEIAAQRNRVWGADSVGDVPSKKKKQTTKSPSRRTKTKTTTVAERTEETTASTGKGERAAKQASPSKAATARKKNDSEKALPLAPLPGARPGTMPRDLEPQLATLTREAPSGEEWMHEIKFDGYRMLCRIDTGTAEFESRNAQNWTSRLRALATAAARLPVKQALLDGEVVALEPNGVSSFQKLQNAFSEGRSDELIYCVFDLLYLDGQDLTKTPLEQRKQALSALIAATGDPAGPIRYTEHVSSNGPDFFKEACKLGLEGIISKRRDRPYRPGRGYDWLKTKCVKRDEFVIGGYTDPGGARSGFGALLVGYHNGGEKLVYAGKVGTGFSDRVLRDLTKRLKPLEQRESPFKSLSGHSGAARGVHWVRPDLVAQLEFSNWTRDALLRHPSFQGLREDKPAQDVHRDVPLPAQAATMKREAAKKSGGNVQRKAGNGSPCRSSRDSRKSGETPLPRSKAGNGFPRSGPRGADKTPVAPQPPEDQDKAGGGEDHPEKFYGVRLSHPNKVMYPGSDFTKSDLAEYYSRVSEFILPHLKDRPLVLVRCPEGEGRTCFFQKHPGMGTPDSLRQVTIQEKQKTANYVLVDDAAGLMSLVQMGVLEIHAWGSRIDKLEQPDRLIFDLDPDPSLTWPQVVAGARQIRQFLADLGLKSFVKTTGGKGLHLVVPIQRRTEWDEAKSFCQEVAQAIVAADPTHYTSNMLKARRTGRIFVDYLRNGRGATAIAAYSTRSRPGAPVSVPIEWDELDEDLRADHFNIQNVPERLAKRRRDPWREFDSTKQSITAAVWTKLRRATAPT